MTRHDCHPWLRGCHDHPRWHVCGGNGRWGVYPPHSVEAVSRFPTQEQAMFYATIHARDTHLDAIQAGAR